MPDDTYHVRAQSARLIKREQEKRASAEFFEAINDLRLEIGEVSVSFDLPLLEALQKLKPYMPKTSRTDYFVGIELNAAEWFEHYVGHFALVGMSKLSSASKTPNGIIRDLEVTAQRMSEHPNEWKLLRKTINQIPDESVRAEKVAALEALDAFEVQFQSLVEKANALVAVSRSNSRTKE